jgi:thioredoxin
MSKVNEVLGEDQYRNYLRNAGGKLVVVDFYADWCGPCQAAAPMYAALSNKYPNVIFLKVNTDKNREIAANAGVRALPTFMLFKNNMKLTEFSGADMQKLENLIMQYGDTFEAFKGSGRTLGSPSGTTGLAGRNVDRSLLASRFGGTTNAAANNKKERNASEPSSSYSSTISDELLKKMEKMTDEELLLMANRVSQNEMSADWEKSGAAPNELNSATNEEEQMKKKEEENIVLEIVSDTVPTQEEVDKQIEQMVDKELLQGLLDLEFGKTRALKALLATGNKDQGEALEWLERHQNDADIDEPIKFNVITPEEKERRTKEEKEKLKQKMIENRERIKALEKKKEKEREIKRMQDGKKIQQTLKELEEAQRKREREAEKLEKKRAREEKARLKRLLEEDKARRKIERLKSEGKFEEAAAIEKEFGFTTSATESFPTSTAAKASTSSSAAASTTEKKEPDECIIRLRLLNGETQACKFYPNDTLQTVFKQATLLQQGNSRFSLIFPTPRRVFTKAEMSMTLKQLGLCPKCQLICSPAV